jgi:hypothetical protein
MWDLEEFINESEWNKKYRRKLRFAYEYCSRMNLEPQQVLIILNDLEILALQENRKHDQINARSRVKLKEGPC